MMKYLRTFESIYSQRGYEIITNDLFELQVYRGGIPEGDDIPPTQDRTHLLPEPLTPSEIQRFESLNHQYQLQGIYVQIGKPFYYECTFNQLEQTTIFTVFKFPDEWFYVDVHTWNPSQPWITDSQFNCYRCDQWEGLINLIQDQIR